MKTIGVFGISGVGKTTLISEIIRHEPTWQCVSAGSLIQQYLAAMERDSLRMLSRGKILENQEAIVWGLSAIRRVSPAEVILFDGHLIVDSDQELIEIPLHVVRRLALDAMVCVFDAPEHIARRRESDPRRRRAGRSKDAIAQEQSRAYSIGERYAGELQLPLLRATPTQHEDVASAIKQWLRM